MKLAVLTIFVVLVAQAIADSDKNSDSDGGWRDKIGGLIKGAFSLFYKTKYENVKKDWEENWGTKIQEKPDENHRQSRENLRPIDSLTRERRSPDITDEALKKFSNMYHGAKDSVKNIVKNFTSSDGFASRHFDKFKHSLSEVGRKIKSSVHNITAPSNED